MSFIPKYIAKRLIPADAVKIENDKVKVKFVNVLAAISTEKSPKNTKDFIEVKIDGQTLFSKTQQNLESGVLLEHKGKKYALNEIQQIGNGIIAAGDILNIFVPNVKNYKPGETHRIEFDLHIGKGFHLDVERIIQ